MPRERSNAAISSAVLHWFEKNKRDFPWRGTFQKPDPYVILFTEIMLQRTRAAQVVPVYLEFVQKYPTFKKLARAPRREVELLFSRLGLKWRTKQVTKLIQALRERGGHIPDDPVKLRELPGVGDYVSKAVLCYAFGKREGPVDTNVVRIISRLFGKVIDPDIARRDKTIVRITQSLVPNGSDAQPFNLALLDLGATICRPVPRCGECPLASFCDFSLQNRALSAAG